VKKLQHVKIELIGAVNSEAVLKTSVQEQASGRSLTSQSTLTSLSMQSIVLDSVEGWMHAVLYTLLRHITVLHRPTVLVHGGMRITKTPLLCLCMSSVLMDVCLNV